ncbi:MAG: hypothetical protein LBC93_00420 [Synergistaceae bacterium]|nr:hypothetical protein [Synergistaceae bacterium]
MLRFIHFESATPSILADYIKRHGLEVENFRELEVPENFTSMMEIEQAPPESFLFQSGYLSVRERRGRKLVLDYPNMEVLSSVAGLFLWGKAGAAGAGVTAVDLEESLARGDAEGLVKIYGALLASIKATRTSTPLWARPWLPWRWIGSVGASRPTGLRNYNRKSMSTT